MHVPLNSKFLGTEKQCPLSISSHSLWLLVSKHSLFVLGMLSRFLFSGRSTLAIEEDPVIF